MLGKSKVLNDKLGVVGELTGARHDVQNKLSVAANNISLAKQRLVATAGSCSIQTRALMHALSNA